MSTRVAHVIVKGVAVRVVVGKEPTFREIVQAALKQTNNDGQPLENWELRDSTGTPILEMDSVVLGDLGIGGMFLNLRAGVWA